MAVTAAPPSAPDITSVTIEEEMRRSYLDYAMSVIVARALPDVRDGLKPVHRRILYSMQTNGNLWNRGYRKSARIVGDVIGKYHPHGELAIYDAMVRMAQDFAMRLPLIDGQGNFGSMDGDAPAAYRYTEARLARVAEALLNDLDKDTVDFQPNYDETEREPKVLPAGFPHLLVNGAQGIAVGMATNIPPHNLGEVIDACCAYLDNPAITIDELMQFVPAPDFPTGGIIIGRSGTHAAYKTGRGAVVIRAKSHVEEVRSGREALVFTEMPYQVNKAKLQERIAECVHEKLVEGIAELRDESDREGVRLVVELKRDADPDIVLNQLFRYTALQTSFGVNMLAINGGRPEQLTLRDIISAFIAFREEVITRRTTYLLNKARERAHTLVGLLVAVASIDEIIALIRAAPDPAAARADLVGRRWPAGDVAPLIALVEAEGRGVAEDGTYQLSDEQARAILDLRLQRLTGLERDKISEELRELVSEIGGHLEILRSRARLIEVLRGELLDIKEQFANPRRTTIEDVEFETDIEDLIQREDMVVTVSHAGYIKRVPLSTYRAQRRGGRGRAGMAIREEDFLSQVFVASTHSPVLFFTSSGRVYKLKVHRLPLGTPQARGRPMVNLLPNLAEGETISTVMPLPEDEESWSGLTVMFATANGYIRRNALSDFIDVRANGKIAMKFEGEDADDRLIAVATCTENDDVLLATRNGKAIRFPVGDVRVFAGRSSVGVRGIRLLGSSDAGEDQVISMSILRHEEISPDVRKGYLGMARDRRRQMGEESEAAEAQTPEQTAEPEDGENGNGTGEAALTEEQFLDLAAREEFVLSVTEKGFGVRSSAYDYRITGRGGQGVNNMDLSRRQDAVVAVFPVGPNDQVMLVTDAGMVIRVPVNDIRIARRGSAGVVVFRVDEEERVVSVARLPEVAEENGDGSNGGEPNGHDPDGPEADGPARQAGMTASEEGREGDH
ncbi:MAG: DNA gyrase subunit A [Alphaproteobacteria bacterium]|nr:DNA gyrase subunit A [Alphaproteobacteria bacterium]MBV9967602.1 DNA gyrase subunit A [Alphaproteobacteria bacterium]